MGRVADLASNQSVELHDGSNGCMVYLCLCLHVVIYVVNIVVLCDRSPVKRANNWYERH